MKKFLFVLALALGLTSVSHAVVKAPVDQKGNTVPVIDFVGASTCRITVSSSTNDVGCTASPTLVYGIMVSSDSGSNFAVFRDSATANHSSAATFSLLPQGNGSANAQPSTVVLKLPVPAKFSNGVSVTMNAAVSNNANSEWIIFYRPLSASEN